MEILPVHGGNLAVDRRGPRDAPAVLLIAGGAQSMDWWMPEFCDELGGGALQLIRYDHRDTGQSSCCPPGEPAYTGTDLATDPLRILDSLGLARAHLVGMSMGGGIAQYLAANHPDRVRSLTLIESSPAGGDHGPLPPPSDAVKASWDEPAPDIDWSDEVAVIDYRVEVERPYAGPGGIDEVRVRAIATAEVRRSRNMQSAMGNHFLVSSEEAVDPATVAAPTLVVHSEDDPMFPIGHGEALARVIPGAELFRLSGSGHEIPPPGIWGSLIPALRHHFER